MPSISNVFENDVKKYGTQTRKRRKITVAMFENDVKKYGTQTLQKRRKTVAMFENDVKKYGTQTFTFWLLFSVSLRMM